MAFIARQGKNGGLEVQGLEAFIEKKFSELKKALGLSAAPVKKKAARKASATGKPKDVTGQLLDALQAHAKGAALAKAGKKPDQLLRSLVPLYLARGKDLEVSSGATSKFWARHGVRFAAPNAAKALREHKGHSTRSKKGPAITPRGVAYVEAALAGKQPRR
jgi:hypothetical protein